MNPKIESDVYYSENDCGLLIHLWIFCPEKDYWAHAYRIIPDTYLARLKMEALNSCIISTIEEIEYDLIHGYMSC